MRESWRDANKDEERVSDAKEVTKERSGGLRWMTLGTLALLAAVAANVFGFRRSRWAVGKDVHRAWEDHLRKWVEGAEEGVGPMGRGSRGGSGGEAGRSGVGSRSTAREEGARAGREERVRNVREMYEKMFREEREGREDIRRKYKVWESVGGEAGRGFQWSSFRVETDFDPRMSEEIMRVFKAMGIGMGGMRRSGAFFEHDEMLREFLRAAEEASRQSRSSRRAGDFDSFYHWEQQQQQQQGRNPFEGFGGFSGFGETGRGGARAGMGQAMDFSDPYETLGVRRGASSAEIKKAYREQAVKWHPDTYKGNNPKYAEKKFREVTQAYELLTKR